MTKAKQKRNKLASLNKRYQHKRIYSCLLGNKAYPTSQIVNIMSTITRIKNVSNFQLIWNLQVTELTSATFVTICYGFVYS